MTRKAVTHSKSRSIDPWKLHFDKANGEVQFSQDGFSAGPLALGFRGYPAEFRLAVGHAVADPANALEARVSGELPLATLFADVPELAPLWPYFPGASPWQVALQEASQPPYF